MTYCADICADGFPGEQAWICSEAVNHSGPHREGNVSWSAGGSQVGDGKHDDNGSDY
jgi:hypothetical protein